MAPQFDPTYGHRRLRPTLVLAAALVTCAADPAEPIRGKGQLGRCAAALEACLAMGGRESF